RVTVVAGLRLRDVADVTTADALVGVAPGRIGHRLHADGHDRVVPAGGVDDGVSLIDRLGHWFFAVDVLAGGGGVDRHLGVPVVRRGDAHDIDFLQVEDAAIILGDVGLVVVAEAALVGGKVQAAADLLVAVPDVADGH